MVVKYDNPKRTQKYIVWLKGGWAPEFGFGWRGRRQDETQAWGGQTIKKADWGGDNDKDKDKDRDKVERSND